MNGTRWLALACCSAGPHGPRRNAQLQYVYGTKCGADPGVRRLQVVLAQVVLIESDSGNAEQNAHCGGALADRVIP